MSSKIDIKEVADGISEFVLMSARTLVSGDPEPLDEHDTMFLACDDSDEDHNTFLVIDGSHNILSKVRISVEIEPVDQPEGD